MKYNTFDEQIKAHLLFLKSHGLELQHLRIGEGFIKKSTRSTPSSKKWDDYAYRSVKFYLKKIDCVQIKTNIRLPDGQEKSFITRGDIDHEFDPAPVRPLKHRTPQLIGRIADPKKDIGVTADYQNAVFLSRVTAMPVVCIYSPLSFEAIARRIRKAFPQARIIIFADNDRHQKKNVSVLCAEKALHACSGSVMAIMAVPYFKNGFGGKKGVSFLDLYRLEGREVAVRQLRKQLQEIKKVRQES